MRADGARKAGLFLFTVFLCAFLLVGSFLSTKTGLGLDEAMEQHTFEVNLRALKGLAEGDASAYATLQGYRDRYYGIGFHAMAWPAQKLLAEFVERGQDLEGRVVMPIFPSEKLAEEGAAASPAAFLLAKHPPVFVLFFLSGILAYLLVRRMTGDETASMLFAVFYLLYPLLLGHGLMNIKDMPFLFGWMLCTCLSLFWGMGYLSTSSFSYGRVVVLALCTAWLLSVRLSGMLIFLQYAVTAFFLFSHGDRRPAGFLRYFAPRGLVFLAVTLAATICLYPVFWSAPWRLWDALWFMGRHPQPAIMMFFGTEYRSDDLPWFYIPLCLAIRLPLLVLVGLICLPDGCGRILRGKDALSFCFGVLLSVCLLVPFVLAVLGAHLYNDLRQILFMVPLFCIVGYVALLRVSRGLTLLFAAVTALFFAADNVMMFPYQYSWFNEALRKARLESDYWALGVQRISERLASLDFEEGRPLCLYVNYYFVEPLYRAFLPRESFSCVSLHPSGDVAVPRPFLAVHNGLDPLGASPIPPDCRKILVETARWSLMDEPVVMNAVSYCPK